MAADDWRTKSTAPMSFPVTVRGGGFHSEADAKGFATIVATCIRVFGCSLNLTSLDSVTIATEDDYTQSLLELDRGVETRSMLSPTKEDHAYGVAMTPTFLRNGTVKSAMFLRTEFILPLNDSDPASYARALHLLYHECAHVEVSMTLDRAFPNFVLRPIGDFVRSLKWFHLLPCWDEFAACYLSASRTPSKGATRRAWSAPK